MPKTVILSAARTPIGKLGGALSSVDATELGSVAIKAALERAEVAPEQVDHVVMGQVLQAGQGQIPSRQAQIKAGIPQEVSSETINKVCASSIRAAGLLDAAIRAGDLEVGVGGGMESMSKAPYLLKEARFGFRMGDGKAIDAMINDGLTNPFSGKHMAHEASEVAAELEMTRADMDKWSLRSHELAIKATDEGRLPEEIAPVTISSRKGDRVVEIDEAPRRDTTLESLSKLKPIFMKDGTHTAGNAPGVNDGGGALVLASDEWAKRNSRQPLATIIAQAQVADDFAYLARTPAKAAQKALELAGLKAEDVDLWEINEAFASVTLNSMRMLEIDESKVNVNGGAVALGHPIGASGARILGSLVLELRRRGGGIGCAAICSGGGQGDAVLVEVNGGAEEGRHPLSQPSLTQLPASVPGPPAAAPIRRGAAFFDLDKTLMEGSSAFQFARAVHETGLMSRRQLASDAWANLRYRLRGASDSQSQELRDRIAASLEGVRVRDLERLGWRVLRGILPRLHPEMLEIAYDHQDAGRPVYIVTAAAQELADVLAQVTAFDGAIGSQFSDSRDGVYTGQASGLFVYGEAKAVAIAQVAEADGLDLDASYAYSDSASDLPMLRAVGHPVVVSPDAELERLARQAGWQVMRLDPLGRRLTVAGALLGAAAAGGIASAVLSSRERRRALASAVPAPKGVRRLVDQGRRVSLR